MKKLIYILTIVCLLPSCNDFLDTNPDDRASVDNETKVAALLVSAYPDKGYQLLAEVSSDNVAAYGVTKGFTLLGADVYTCEEECATANESPK